MNEQHEEHLVMWFKSVLDGALTVVGEIPSSPVITAEFDRALGRLENLLRECRAIVDMGRAINK
jgi:hypothetical protein